MNRKAEILGDFDRMDFCL